MGHILTAYQGTQLLCAITTHHISHTMTAYKETQRQHVAAAAATVGARLARWNAHRDEGSNAPPRRVHAARATIRRAGALSVPSTTAARNTYTDTRAKARAIPAPPATTEQTVACTDTTTIQIQTYTLGKTQVLPKIAVLRTVDANTEKECASKRFKSATTSNSNNKNKVTTTSTISRSEEH
eukprot:scpid85570/ scgid5440/ 